VGGPRDGPAKCSRTVSFFSFHPEDSVKKRLTFGFLPWVAAVAICSGSGFARGQESVIEAGSVLANGGVAHTEPAIVEGEAPSAADSAIVSDGGIVSEGTMGSEGAAAGGATRKVLRREWVTETRDVNVTEYAQEQRERSYTVTKRVPRTEQRTREYTVNVPETRTKTVNYTVNTKAGLTACGVRVEEERLKEEGGRRPPGGERRVHAVGREEAPGVVQQNSVGPKPGDSARPAVRRLPTPPAAP
jgi:hypothetical protein